MKSVLSSTYLAGGLVQTQLMPELVLAHGAGCVNLVAEDKEGDLGELLNGEEGVKLRLGLGEPLKISTVDEEDDTVDLREVVTPETTRCSHEPQCHRRRKMNNATHPVGDHPNRTS